MVTFGYKQIKRVTAVYVALPVLTFLIGYMKPVIGLPGAAVFIAALWSVLRSRNTELSHDSALTFSVRGIMLLFVVILLWGYLGGLNGFFYQSSDWGIRNAVYRDLVTHRWPVVYGEKMTALVYYIGHWLVPAAAAKPFYHLFGTRIGWFVARQLLWGWTSLGLFLLALELMVYTNADTRRKKVLCMVGLIGFSGMDALGAWVAGRWDAVTAPETLHFEWWSKNYQFSSLTTCLYWVFNQAVIPWLIVMSVLFERDPRNYLFWGVTCLLCGPFPFVGLVVLMLVKAGVFLVGRARERAWADGARAVFSPANLILLFTVLPVLALFFMANNAVSAGVASSAAGAQESVGAAGVLRDGIPAYLRTFLHVFVLDVGVYLYLISARRKKDPLFYAIALSLLILPYFKIGNSWDFAMRSTIPAVFVLMVYVVDEGIWAVERWHGACSGQRLKSVCLLGVFLVGMMTPGMEIYRGLYNVWTKGTVRLEDRSVMTLEGQPVSLNFEAAAFTDSAFFSKLAKRPRTDTVAAVCANGLYEAETLDESAAEASFRWGQRQADIVLYNGYSDPVEARLEMVFAVAEDVDEPYTVTVACEGQTYVYEISGPAQTVEIPVTMVDTATKVHITSDGEQLPLSGEDDRAVFFSVGGVRLYDVDGGILAGPEPQHPELESGARLAAG